MALDLNKTFCTAITEVERYAVFDATATSVPTESQVEEYTYDVASIIVVQTVRAGQRYAPPVSSVSDTHLARLLTQANAIGAAYYARQHVYTLNGDERSNRVMQRLAGLWQSYMGEGAINIGAGLAALQFGNGGLIAQTIGSASGSLLVGNDVTEGETTLGTITSREVSPPFSMTDTD